MTSSGYERVEYKGWIDKKAKKAMGSPKSAIEVAEESIRSLDPQYRAWINLVLKNLGDHIRNYTEAPSDESHLHYIRELAHELRGTTGSFGRMKTSDVSQSLYEQAVEGPAGLGVDKFVVAMNLYHQTLVMLADLDGPDPDPQLDEIVKGLDVIKEMNKAAKA